MAFILLRGRSIWFWFDEEEKKTRIQKRDNVGKKGWKRLGYLIRTECLKSEAGSPCGGEKVLYGEFKGEEKGKLLIRW